VTVTTAIETLSIFNLSALLLPNDLGMRIFESFGEVRETSLFQRLSVTPNSASMLFCCMTVCQPLTARTEFHIGLGLLVLHFHFVFHSLSLSFSRLNNLLRDKLTIIIN